MRDYLRWRGILGNFDRRVERAGDGRPLPPEAWREYCLASVTTTTRRRPRAILWPNTCAFSMSWAFTESLTELANAATPPDMLRERGFPTATEPKTRTPEALHRYSGTLSCAVRSPHDEVGTAAENQPGTSTEYPNWKIPLSGPDGKPLSMEDLYTDERAFRLAGIMNGFTAPMRLPRSETELVI